jgi:serine/threonine-protein kinase
MGTVAYMSPEQKFSSANVTKASDIYSVGVILYEICCGKKPAGHFKMPSELNPDVPKAFDPIVIKCLEESPGERFPTAGALKDALLNAFGGKIYDSGGAEATIARLESFMGKCRFLDTIKDDHFSATHMVENKETNKLYIIKQNKKGDAGLREAKILASLSHKNIINILGAGGSSTKAVVVSDYAPGGSLVDRLVRPYSWKEAMDIILQISEGLEFAHKNNIIHGDLRPSNVLFDKNDRIKLTDFGLASHYTGQKDWYAPPEKQATKQGDMYSLGIILFMLLTNKIPQHDRSGNPYLSELGQKIPETIIQVLTKLLQIRAAKRYRSLDEMQAEYSEFLKSLEKPKVEVSEPPRERTERQKNYTLAILIAVAIMLGVFLAIFWDSMYY